MIGLRRMDRYVLREIVGPSVLGFTVWTFIAVMNAFFLVAQQAISKNLGWDLTFRLFLLALPELLVLTIPMGVLLGTLVGIGRLSADSEWVAIQASGHGTRILVRPAVVVGLVASLVSFYLYSVVVPDSRFATRRTRAEVFIAGNLASDLKPRTFYAQQPGVILFVDEIRPGNPEGRLEGVFLHRHERPDGSHKVILARHGNLYPALDGSGDLQADLWDVVVHRFRAERPDEYLASTNDFLRERIPPPQFLEILRKEPDRGIQDMHMAALRREIDASRALKPGIVREVRLRNARLEYHLRFALPLGSLLFAILAVPLGITRVRSGKGAGFALSIGIFLLYFVVFRVLREQASRGNVDVVLGAWSGNLVVVPLFAWSLWRLKRPARTRIRPVRMLVRGLRWGFGRLRRSPAPVAGEAREWSNGEAPPPSTRWIHRLDLYVGLQYLRLVGLSLVAVYVLFFVMEMQKLFGSAMERDGAASLVLEYMKYFAPGVLPFVLPMSCLVGAIIAMTLLGRAGELTAIKASGMSARRVTVPILSLSAALCGLFFVVQDRIAPVTNQRKEEIKDEILNRTPRSYGTSSSGRWVFGEDGRTLYNYRVYDQELPRFQALHVFTLDRAAMRILEHRFYESARWNGTSWEATEGWRRSFRREREAAGDSSPPESLIRSFDRIEGPLALRLDPPGHFSRETLVASTGDDVSDQMSIQQTLAEIRSLERSGYDTTRLEVSYQLKLARPVTPLVMVLLGLPFAFRIGRRGSLYGIGVAIILVIVYWATFAIFQALGLETILPPFLAAWAPNVLYGVLGLTLLLYVRT